MDCYSQRDRAYRLALEHYGADGARKTAMISLALLAALVVASIVANGYHVYDWQSVILVWAVMAGMCLLFGAIWLAYALVGAWTVRARFVSMKRLSIV